MDLIILHDGLYHLIPVNVELIADHIWKEIEKRYDDIEVIDLPHAKLHDILIHTPKTTEDLKSSHHNPVNYYPRVFCRNVWYFKELGVDYLKKNWDGKPGDTPKRP